MSKAQEALRQLDNVTAAAGNAEDVSAALDRLEGDPGAERVPQSDEDGDAEFGTFEAIATGVVATAILGPLGGVLVGGAQGFLTKKAEQGVLDQLARNENALTDSVNIYQAQLDGFKGPNTTPEDLKEISAMEAGLAASLGMYQTADPQLMAAGVTGIQGVQSSMENFARNQDTQKIASDIENERRAVELGDKRDAKYTQLHGDYVARS
jgi:hypothetical protein